MSYDFGIGLIMGALLACLGVMVGAIVANAWRRWARQPDTTEDQP